MSILDKIVDLLFGWLKKKKEKDGKPETPQYPDAIDPAEIRWLGVDVGKWQVKYPLKVWLSGSKIVYDQKGTSEWPVVHAAGVSATGNPWIVIRKNGEWIAATHEWMRINQIQKGKRSVHGDHIKRSEFGADWTPTVGEEYGFCVSGLCRGPERNVSERTQIIKTVWR